MSGFLRSGKRPRQRDIRYQNDENEKIVSNLELSPRNVVSNNGPSDHLVKLPNRVPEFTTFRAGWQELRLVYKAATTNRRAKKIIDGCGWVRLFAIDVPNSDKRLVEGLVERWWDTTHTFHFPHLEIGITPYDFTFLTGIPIGRGDPPPFAEVYTEDYETTMHAYFHRMMNYVDESHQGLKSNGIRVSALKTYIMSSKNRVLGIDEEEEVARIFLLWVIGQVFFANPGSVVNPGWLAALEDLDQVHTYDWGSAILGRIYRSLDECCRQVRSFNGMWMLLEYWFYTYFRMCEPNMDPNVGSMDVWPRISAYNKERRSKKQIDTGKHSLHVCRQQIEITTPQATVWTPYKDSRHNGELDIKTAYHLSTHRVILFDPEFDVGFWYLGDRCWRQIHGEIVIPTNPPHRESLSNVPQYIFSHRKAVGWVTADMYILQASEDQYKRYWKHVSIGAILPFLSNKEGLGSTASQDPSLHIPNPPLLANEAFTYQTPNPPLLANEALQGHSVAYSTFVDWNLEVAGPAGQPISIPIIPRSDRTVLSPDMYTKDQWAELASQLVDLTHQIRKMCLTETARQEQQIRQLHEEIRQRAEENSHLKLILQKRDRGQTSGQERVPQPSDIP